LCKLNRKWIGICHIPSSKARVISESDSSWTSKGGWNIICQTIRFMLKNVTFWE
jgi:hypothetical protein